MRRDAADLGMPHLNPSDSRGEFSPSLPASSSPSKTSARTTCAHLLSYCTFRQPTISLALLFFFLYWVLGGSTCTALSNPNPGVAQSELPHLHHRRIRSKRAAPPRINSLEECLGITVETPISPVYSSCVLVDALVASGGPPCLSTTRCLTDVSPPIYDVATAPIETVDILNLFRSLMILSSIPQLQCAELSTLLHLAELPTSALVKSTCPHLSRADQDPNRYGVYYVLWLGTFRLNVGGKFVFVGDWVADLLRHPTASTYLLIQDISKFFRATGMSIDFYLDYDYGSDSSTQGLGPISNLTAFAHEPPEPYILFHAPDSLTLRPQAVVGFGRAKLSVRAAGSCFAWKESPATCIEDGKELPNCTSWSAPGYTTGVSDYDMLPPARLRHSVKSAKPPLHCQVESLIPFNFFWKLFTNQGAVEYWLAVTATLESASVQPASLLIAHPPCDPRAEMAIYRMRDGRAYIASDALHHDFEKYGALVTYDGPTPGLGRVHHFFSGDDVEVWGLLVDLDDVQPLPNSWGESLAAFCPQIVGVGIDHNCTSLDIRYYGTYIRQQAVYSVLSTEYCFMIMETHTHNLYMLIANTSTLFLANPGSTVRIGGDKFRLPPAPQRFTDFADEQSTVRFKTSIFSLLDLLVDFLSTLLTSGPLSAVRVLGDHIIDALAGVLFYQAVKQLRFRLLFGLGLYWYIRLVV